MSILPSAFIASACALMAVTGRASEGAAGPDQTICGTSAVMSADPLGPGATGYWAVVSGAASFSDDHDPFTLVTGLASGDNVLQWTTIINGSVDVDQVTITVFDPAATVAEAGPDSVLCAPTDEMTLMATPAAYPAIGSWSSVGIALIDVFTDPASTVSFPSQGSVQMIWTVFNGSCGQTSDTAVITVQECLIGMEEPVQAIPHLTFDALSNSILWCEARDGAWIEVLDERGRRVSRADGLAPSGRITLGALAPGLFVARLGPEAHARAIRFVVAPVTTR